MLSRGQQKNQHNMVWVNKYTRPLRQMAIKAVYISTIPDTLERIKKQNDYNKENSKLDSNYTEMLTGHKEAHS